MRVLISLLGLLSLCGCSSFGGVMSSETTWFQDWSCQRQDGVCARTDTIDAITLAELGGDPAKAGPVSGYPAEGLPLSATPELLQGVRPLDRGYFDEEIERGRPFLTETYADEQAEAVPAILGSARGATSIDQIMTGNLERQDTDPFLEVFPEAEARVQLTVLGDKLAGGVETADPEPRPEPGPVRLNSIMRPVEGTGSDLERVALEAVSDVPDPIIRRDTSSGTMQALDPRESVETRAETVNAGSPEEPLGAAAPLRSAILPEPERQIADAPPAASTASGPRRSAARILPVIISAYVDARGVFHVRTIVWLEVEPADWIID